MWHLWEAKRGVWWCQGLRGETSVREFVETEGGIRYGNVEKRNVEAGEERIE